MTWSERALTFACEGDDLVGIISSPADRGAASVGVLIVVGGPQYRVGSHRQFALLARQCATAGVACMRFDCRGMGDGLGNQRSFESLDRDIAAAMDAFLMHEPSVRKVVLWGLCDGASAACLYAPSDDRVGGLILLNPWVRNAVTEARTYIKHYYAKRIVSGAFWRRLLGGQVNLLASIPDFLRKYVQSRQLDARTDVPLRDDTPASLPARMLQGVELARCPVAVFLSGRDYVAREFEDAMATEPGFKALHDSSRLIVTHFYSADHTFSSAATRLAVAEASLHFLKSAFSVDSHGSGGSGVTA